MAATRIDARRLPAAPLDAAASFHARIVPQVRAQAGSDVLVLFSAEDHTHADWRRAAIAELAREAAPSRVNAVAGGDEQALAQLAGYLDHALGVTGQVLAAEA